MLVEYTCSGQVAKVTPMRWSHTPAVGKLLMDTHARWSHTLRSLIIDTPGINDSVGKFLENNKRLAWNKRLT